jgi:S-adenosylmethionine-diacylgycerolhomoserine-N-methlytransferase
MIKSNHSDNLIRHYKKDAEIYDINRRFFLFGRNRLVKIICEYLKPTSILEIGCGTGVNLVKLNHMFPNSKITGLDLSKDMLKVAKRKLDQFKNVSLINDIFDHNTNLTKFDLILCSYTVSTVPNVRLFLSTVHQHLADDGHFACVDFYNSGNAAFKRWISHSIPIHTNFPEHLLHDFFTFKHFEVKRAYGGVWKYFNYIGQKQ